jgi:predicted nuclease with TOPRIM domain
MTQANEPIDRDRSLNRQLRVFERRLTRLEETQLTGKEINLFFDRVYDEIDALEVQMTQRFDRLETRFDRLETRFDELNRKFDMAIATLRDRTRIAGD